ncbi:TPA: dihydrodipicolinate synthase family protein [Candidatus Poribacteria bacterium]|nr:dihydrodipicolinate synthase family protein [Candidatus Poribacteria bacterium]HIA65280.1 dihydrodipicolinate synthase family protein [Candidatus Poribacteria bacterium]HIB98368.1 dihydrodipicolinate synthase family protein [Candidatus Poribacteria bacterium]HIO79288.1 dihydrodipicolinate synthase family protein [Candidatus Poribacteria bacterium]
MSFTLAHGSVPPMVTPMTEDAASIDRDGIAALVEWHIEAGTTGLFVVCSTGEMFALNQDEMVEIVETAVISADGRIPIIAGLPFPDVNRKAKIAKRYETVGVDGGVALQPFESPADDDTMYEHYARLADEVKIPLFIYEHPKWQSTHLLTPALVGRLVANVLVKARRQLSSVNQRLCSQR